MPVKLSIWSSIRLKSYIFMKSNHSPVSEIKVSDTFPDTCEDLCLENSCIIFHDSLKFYPQNFRDFMQLIQLSYPD